MIHYNIDYKYTSSKTYKTIPYAFENEAEFDEFMVKENKDHSIRRITGVHPRNTNKDGK
jgi:hypothetical protein